MNYFAIKINNNTHLHKLSALSNILSTSPTLNSYPHESMKLEKTESSTGRVGFKKQ